MRVLNVYRPAVMTLAEYAEVTDYLTLQEFAQAAGVSEITVRRWLKAGHGPKGELVDRQYRFSSGEVLAFVEGRE